MNHIHYSVRPNEKITNFTLKPISTVEVNAVKDVVIGEVAHVEDYFDVEYPVRKAFMETNDISKIPYENNGFSEIYVPFERDRVDCSAFISTPRKVYTYAKTFIIVDQTGDYHFSFKTCGAAIIWVNQEKAFSFAPYTRNLGSETDLILKLHNGINEVVIYFEDLAERDVNFYFEMINHNESALEGFIETTVSPSEFTEVKDVLYN